MNRSPRKIATAAVIAAAAFGSVSIAAGVGVGAAGAAINPQPDPVFTVHSIVHVPAVHVPAVHVRVVHPANIGTPSYTSAMTPRPTPVRNPLWSIHLVEVGSTPASSAIVTPAPDPVLSPTVQSLLHVHAGSAITGPVLINIHHL